uniref:Acyl carrier protein n=1 Tax=Rhabditophanes sp. KR3021 TaxID=114890 RepID=A0AC35TN89_9BILA
MLIEITLTTYVKPMDTTAQAQVITQSRDLQPIPNLLNSIEINLDETSLRPVLDLCDKNEEVLDISTDEEDLDAVSNYIITNWIT